MKLIQIEPPNYLYAAIIIMLLLHFLFFWDKFIYYPFTLLGIFPLAIGIALNLTADSLFKKQNTTVKPLLEPEVLITIGVFKITRNPMYLGFALILIGIAILLGSILPFLIAIIFTVFIYIVFIRFEEKKLEELFGSKWLEYKK